MFSDLVWELRLKRQLLLREFCKLAFIDVRVWSRVEQGLELPPQDEETLKRIAMILNVEQSEFAAFRNEALSAKVKLPTEEEFVKSLPLFCRSFGNEKSSREQLFKIADVLRPGKNII